MIGFGNPGGGVGGGGDVCVFGEGCAGYRRGYGVVVACAWGGAVASVLYAGLVVRENRRGARGRGRGVL